VWVTPQSVVEFVFVVGVMANFIFIYISIPIIPLSAVSYHLTISLGIGCVYVSRVFFSFYFVPIYFIIIFFLSYFSIAHFLYIHFIPTLP